MITSFALLAFAASGAAAPGEKQPSQEAINAAEPFARQLSAIAEIVHREYVRPIPKVDLYEAALHALYDAARRTRPESLLRDLKASKDGADQIECIRRARAELHGSPGLDNGRDLVVAVCAFTRVLDPHSALLPSGSINGTTTANTYGFEFEGEALALRGPSESPLEPGAAGIPPTPFRVLSVKPGSPAQKAGLRPGDIIRDVNGIVVDSTTAAKAFASLHGVGADKTDPGVHQLLVDRAGFREPLKLQLERTSFVPESIFGVTRKWDNTWDYWLDAERRIAYVRLSGIENDSGDRLQEILHDLRDIRGLIFDLRWCPGGYIDSATQIASTFLESGVIAKMKYRNPDRGENTTIHADGGLIRYKAGDYPVLVLVNGETIGGGELIAAALKDNGRAVVAGSRTYGKATIQWPMQSLAGLAGYSFKLTGGTYSRPNGKNLQRFPDSKPTDDWGLRPDPGYEIPMSADVARQLKELHLLYSLRPGGSKESMDLDDPLADPQRARALKLIRKLADEKRQIKD
jgi:C-terminal peptidase prc